MAKFSRLRRATGGKTVFFLARRRREKNTISRAFYKGKSSF